MECFKFNSISMHTPSIKIPNLDFRIFNSNYYYDIFPLDEMNESYSLIHLTSLP